MKQKMRNICAIALCVSANIFAETGIKYRLKVLSNNVAGWFAESAQSDETKRLSSLKLPPGFMIDIYARVPDARSLTLSEDGVVFVGTRRAGKIYAIVPNKQRTKAKKVVEIDSNLSLPNGVAYKDGSLYVAAVNKLIKYENVLGKLSQKQRPIIITDKLPSSSYHGWRYLKFGPDGWLYVSIGAPCNACLSNDQRYASIMRIQSDGSNQQIYAHGVRNTVGFTWHPKTQQLWFTDNGKDWLGDNEPADEINVAEKAGLHFGFPYVHAGNILDQKFGKNVESSNFQPPLIKLQAHTAPLGLLFYVGKLFPSQYVGRLLVAQHGSWNRSSKVGYQISSIQINNQTKTSETKTFISGWLQGQKYWGRPVDLLQMPDGALLISDDYAGLIYRVSYQD